MNTTDSQQRAFTDVTSVRITNSSQQPGDFVFKLLAEFKGRVKLGVEELENVLEILSGGGSQDFLGNWLIITRFSQEID